MRKIIIVYFLLLISNHIIAQSDSDSIQTLDHLLQLKWTAKGQNYSSNPLVHDGIIFETFGLDYALDALTGEKLYFNRPEHKQKIKSYTKDSLVYFTSRGGTALVNIYSGRIIYKSRNKINDPWAKSPRIVRGPFLFSALSDSIFASIEIRSGKIVWQMKLKDVYDLPIITEDLIYVGASKCLYILGKNTGKQLRKIEIGKFASDPQIISNVLYVWVEGRGLISYDLNRRKIVWEKVQDREAYEYEIIIENDAMFSNSKHLTAYSYKDGKVLWDNKEFRSSDSFVLASTRKYILAYKTVDDYSLLTANDKEKGLLAYQGFTTAYDNFKNPKPVRQLANLEGKHFRFGNKMHNNLLYAVDHHGNIYCFEVKE